MPLSFNRQWRQSSINGWLLDRKYSSVLALSKKIVQLWLWAYHIMYCIHKTLCPLTFYRIRNVNKKKYDISVRCYQFHFVFCFIYICSHRVNEYETYILSPEPAPENNTTSDKIKATRLNDKKRGQNPYKKVNHTIFLSSCVHHWCSVHVE